MKNIRFILCALILLGSTQLQAAPVSKARALEVAKMIFTAQPATKAASGNVQFIWDGEDIATKAAVQPAFYVFGREGGGFVIVAGDDNVKPVLALSDRNEFKVEGMPDHVKWWMERMKAYVRSASSQAPGVRDEWAQYTPTKAGAAITGEVTVVTEHLTPEWGQSAELTYNSGNSIRRVFNSKCPKIGDKYTLTGCVATALGEVLTTMSGLHYSMPTRPYVAQVEPYTTEEGTVPATQDGNPYVFSDEDYNWAGLRTLTSMGAIGAAVAAEQFPLLDNLDKLLADLGAMMHADYGTGGTGAVTGNAPDSLGKYMGMNKLARYEYANSYTRPQWEAMLKTELDKHPIVYTGLNIYGGGHAFVFDAYGTYQGDDVFHVNFGWKGKCNGYYYEYNLDSDGTETYNFSQACATIFDFYPDPTSPEPPVVPGNISYYSTPGMTYTFTNDDGETWEDVPSFGEGGTRFTIRGWIINKGKVPYAGVLKIALLDKDNNIKQDNLYTDDISSDPWGTNEGWPYYWFDLKNITVPFAFGDKLVAFYSTEDPNNPWKRVEVPVLDCYIVSELPVFPAAFIKTEDSYSAGDPFNFVLRNHIHPYAGTVWTFTKDDGSRTTLDQAAAFFPLESGTYKIEAAVAEKVGGPVLETLVTYITVQ